MARPKKNGVFDYKEKNGKYSYYVKVVYIRDIEGNRKRRPIRARTLGELKEKVAQALEESVSGNENANDSKALEKSVTDNENVGRTRPTLMPFSLSSLTAALQTRATVP